MIYHVDVHYDKMSKKMVLEAYKEGDEKKTTLLLIPLGPSVAYRPADAQGVSEVVRFGEEEGVPYVEIFGARHTPVK